MLLVRVKWQWVLVLFSLCLQNSLVIGSSDHAVSLRGMANQSEPHHFRSAVPLFAEVDVLVDSPVMDASFYQFYQEFTGSNVVNYGTVTNAPTNQMTVSFWIRTTQTSDGVILWQGRDSKGKSPGQFVFLIENGCFTYWEANPSGTGMSGRSKKKINTGMLVHVVFVKMFQQGWIYIDGSFDTALSTTRTVSFDNHDLIFATESSGRGRAFKGELYDFTMSRAKPLTPLWSQYHVSLAYLTNVSMPNTVYSLDHFIFDGNSPLSVAPFSNAPTTKMTVSFWIKTTQRNEAILAWIGRDAALRCRGQIVLLLSQEGFQYWESDCNGYVGLSFTSAMKINTGKYVHLAFVKNGMSGSMYIDGVLQKRIDTQVAVSCSTNGIVFGKDLGTYGPRAFTGEIHGFKLFNYPLFDHHISLLYQANNVPTISPTINPTKVPTKIPSQVPSRVPTQAPTRVPTTIIPTTNPTSPTEVPSLQPTWQTLFSMPFMNFYGNSSNYYDVSGFPRNQFSVSLWIKASYAGQYNDGIIFFVGTRPPTRPLASFSVKNNAGIITYSEQYVYSDGQGMVRPTNVCKHDRIVQVDSYVHIVLVQSGAALKMYVNGVLKNCPWYISTPSYSGENLIFGDSFFHTSFVERPFLGEMYKFRLFDRQLSEAEVSWLYKELPI